MREKQWRPSVATSLNLRFALADLNDAGRVLRKSSIRKANDREQTHVAPYFKV
jgi:hypothetical protein